MKKLIMVCIVLFAFAIASAETIFIEAEDFTPSSNGWKVISNSLTRLASKQKVLYGVATTDMRKINF